MTVAIGQWEARREEHPRRSLAFSQKKRFPVAELARERATLRKEYLSKSKELSARSPRLPRTINQSQNIVPKK